MRFFVLFLFCLFPVRGVLAIEVQDLRPGDLIFYMNTLGLADHVALFAGFKEDGRAYLVHAVTRSLGLGAEDSLVEAKQAVAVTLLPSTHSKSGVDVPYQVVRNRDPVLALAASRRMRLWAHYMVPYDEESAFWMYALGDTREFNELEEAGVQRHCELARTMSFPNFYRRIKYAARRTFPVYPPKNPSQDFWNPTARKGFRCSNSTVLAYQVEEIVDYLKKPYFSYQEASELARRRIDEHEFIHEAHLLPPAESTEALKNIDAFWVSDKYTSPKTLDELKVSDGYRAYQKRLVPENRGGSVEYVGLPLSGQRSKTYSMHHRSYAPSIMAWDFDRNPSIEEFARNFDSCLTLDSKIVSSAVLFYYVQKDSAHWNRLGPLSVRVNLPTTPDRVRHRNMLFDSIARVHEDRNSFVEDIENPARGFFGGDETPELQRSPSLFQTIQSTSPGLLRWVTARRKWLQAPTNSPEGVEQPQIFGNHGQKPSSLIEKLSNKDFQTSHEASSP